MANAKLDFLTWERFRDARTGPGEFGDGLFWWQLGGALWTHERFLTFEEHRDLP